MFPVSHKCTGEGAHGNRSSLRQAPTILPGLSDVRPFSWQTDLFALAALTSRKRRRREQIRGQLQNLCESGLPKCGSRITLAQIWEGRASSRLGFATTSVCYFGFARLFWLPCGEPPFRRLSILPGRRFTSGPLKYAKIFTQIPPASKSAPRPESLPKYTL